MSAPKKKFQDRIKVYSTKSGTQYVRPRDVLKSETAKNDMQRIRDTFAKESRHPSGADKEDKDH